MPPDIIQVKYEVLETVAQQFEAAAQGIEEMLQEVRAGVENLQGEWIGLGSDAFFRDMIGEVLPATERLRDAFHEAAQVTRRISTTMRTAEEQAAALFQNGAAGGSIGKALLSIPIPPDDEETSYER